MLRCDAIGCKTFGEKKRFISALNEVDRVLSFMTPLRTFESRLILSDAIVLVFGPKPDRYRWHRIGIGEAFEVTSTISITAAE